MGIEIANNSGIACNEDEIVDVAAFALDKMGIHPDSDLGITLVDEDEITKLHVQWMNLPGPTDVLSFPMDIPVDENEAVTLGDIVISPIVAADQAAAAGHSAEREIFILAAHGLLHILGYDHANPADEKIMFAKQEDLVKKYEALA